MRHAQRKSNDLSLQKGLQRLRQAQAVEPSRWQRTVSPFNFLSDLKLEFVTWISQSTPNCKKGTSGRSLSLILAGGLMASAAVVTSKPISCTASPTPSASTASALSNETASGSFNRPLSAVSLEPFSRPLVKSVH